MKQRFLFTCVAILLLASRPAVLAVSQDSGGPSAGSSAKAPHKGWMARNPYRGAIVVDAASGRVLFEDQADVRGYPASMQKLMDLLIILDKIEHGQLSLQDKVPVSAKAAKTGGSQVWLAEKEVFSLDEMLYALMVQSANDAAVALAEKVAGSTDAFVELMNQKARELGMNSTVFHSVHGLPPGPGQEHDVTTARDFAVLCREVVKHPEALRYTSTREKAFRENVPNKTVVMRAHNHLLGHVEGCDGLKTGYFAQAGFSIAVTAARQGQRVIVVVLDSPDLKTRDHKATELVAKGFAALASARPATNSAAHETKSTSASAR
jgi:serine-type D-Ala-D-Ala carboxypeptidase (penicillin-binding protein 5/6)